MMLWAPLVTVLFDSLAAQVPLPVLLKFAQSVHESKFVSVPVKLKVTLLDVVQVAVPGKVSLDAGFETSAMIVVLLDPKLLRPSKIEIFKVLVPSDKLELVKLQVVALVRFVVIVIVQEMLAGYVNNVWFTVTLSELLSIPLRASETVKLITGVRVLTFAPVSGEFIVITGGVVSTLIVKLVLLNLELPEISL